MDKLRAIELFICVCENNSFTNAAKILGTSPSSISKAISRLEDELQFKLFTRTSRNLSLTNSGEVYFESVKSIIDSIEQLESGLRSGNNDTSGVIHINSPFDYGRTYIQPFLTRFAQEYPDIQIELRLDDNYINASTKDTDILIRTGPIEDSSMIAHKLSPMDFLICASPQYLKSLPEPITINNIVSCSWIRFRLKKSGKLAPINIPHNNATKTLDPKAHYITDYGQTVGQMCADGLGIAQLPHFLAKQWLEKGELIPLFSPYCPPSYGVYILFGERKYLPKRVRILIDSLSKFVKSLGEYPEHTWSKDLRIK